MYQTFTIFYNYNIIGHVYTLTSKLPIPKNLKWNEIKCENCNGIYIRHTVQHLKNGLAAHKSSIKI